MNKQSKGSFRKDLYYRLMAHHIAIPPLRERLADLPLLIDFFLEQAAAALKKKKPALPRELYTLLGTYSFPGNVRELQSLIFDAVGRHESGMLSLVPIREYMNSQRSPGSLDNVVREDTSFIIDHTGAFPTLAEIEEYFISEALDRAEGNQSIAAQLPGINQSTLSRRLSKK